MNKKKSKNKINLFNIKVYNHNKNHDQKVQYNINQQMGL